MQRLIRRILACAVVAVLGLPLVLVVLGGFASLLGNLGDESGARACGKLSIVLGVIWVCMIVVTAVTNGIVALAVNPFERHRRVRRPRRIRTVRRNRTRRRSPGLPLQGAQSLERDSAHS